MRVINTESYDSVSKVSPVIIEEIQVFDTEAPVTNLLVIQPTAGEDSESTGPRLLVVSNEEVQTIPLRRCYTNKITTCRLVFFHNSKKIEILIDSFFNCSECVALQDPYCAWNGAVSRCVTVASVPSSAQSSLIQSIFTGYSDQCPDNGTNNL